MCGVFGVIGRKIISEQSTLRKLVQNTELRGRDASGFIVLNDERLHIYRADTRAQKLFSKTKIYNCQLILGHSRLITHGLHDNQPVYRDDIILLHNGIVLNSDDLWNGTKRVKKQQLDSEIIVALFADALEEGLSEEQAGQVVLSKCEGIVSAIIYMPKRGKLCILSNNGSMYLAARDDCMVFTSERWPLEQAKCHNILNIKGVKLLEAPIYKSAITETNSSSKNRRNLVPEFITVKGQEKKLVYPARELRRCSRCILPETMPFITFNDDGICNFCLNHKPLKKEATLSTLKQLVAPYKQKDRVDCVVPFSGGRDSCFALHLAVAELGMRPIAYTYEWGMVTDLGRRNISRMCAELGVENIIIAADIEKKRKNIRINLKAWLKKPHLGMINLLMAGDKHFFKHVETIKNKVGAPLNLWGINPLETTHFKAGFLGIAPSFHSESVYRSGMHAQYDYQKNRFKQMMKNPAYFNGSLFDTLSGEYWRSIHKKTDYFHLFDYYTWDEAEINNTLSSYNWETALDTKSTWRIGDGTAAFYNYVYYKVAGFSEHDTFRSNQIRAGQITREKALELIRDENRPRYANIKWYLDAVGIDFDSCIDRVNSIKPIY